MISSLRKILALAAIGAALLGSANATPITGEIYFDGGFITTNTGNLATATAITGYTGVQEVSDAFGSYGTVPVGTAVTFSPFAFGAGSVTPLWTFTIGATTYSFNATSIVVDSQNNTFLNVGGTGIANITGYSATSGSWSITSTTQGQTRLTFSGANAVPDSGATVMLLGAGLAGLAFAARRFKRSAV